jgi:hypothetical protein
MPDRQLPSLLVMLLVVVVISAVISDTSQVKELQKPHNYLDHSFSRFSLWIRKAALDVLATQAGNGFVPLPVLPPVPPTAAPKLQRTAVDSVQNLRNCYQLVQVGVTT